MKKISLLGFFLFTIYKSNAQEFSNLELMEVCKIWGYVKYNTCISKNLDKDLFHLLTFKLSMDSFVLSNNAGIANIDFDSKGNINCVDNQWIDSLKIINFESRNILKNEKWQSTNNKYFKGLKTSKIDPRFKLLNETEFVEDISKPTFLLGVFRLWNFLNYFYPYRCKLENWDKVLFEAISILNENYCIDNYEKALMHIFYSIKDAHSVLYYTKPQLMSLNLKNIGQVLPFTFEMINNSVVIKTSFDSLLKRNDILLSINGNSVQNYIKMMNPLDTLHRQQAMICATGNTTILEIIRDTIKTTFDMSQRTIHKSEWGKLIFNTEYLNPLLNHFSIIHINEIATKFEYEKAKEIIKKKDTLILNLTGYPKSKFANKLIKEFYPKNKITTYHLVEPLPHFAGCFTKKEVKENGTYSSRKKIYVLVNNFTQSWSETLAISLLQNTDVEFFGTNSANGFGQVNYILPLPGGIHFSTTNVGIFDATGKSWYPTGIIPNKNKEILKSIVF